MKETKQSQRLCFLLRAARNDSEIPIIQPFNLLYPELDFGRAIIYNQIMKKIILYTVILMLGFMSAVQADQTRMDVLMAGDYIDDIVNIGIYPHHIAQYQNFIYGDIKSTLTDYGIMVSLLPKLGALGLWQNPEPGRGFNIGYAIDLKKIEIGLFASPVEDNMVFGIGVGRGFFDKRFDLSFLVSDAVNDEWYKFNVRFARRRNDFVFVPKYTLDYVTEPFEYTRHRIGLMLQRLIFNEGFVFLIAEYDISRGDIESELTHIHGGIDLPISRKVGVMLGIKENFTEGFESLEWFVEPGISVRIREFRFDFHLNQERLFDKDVTFFNSFGLELSFGRF
jgi:hypothetical protein